MLSKRFPFAIYYKVQEDTVIVYAILDCRQNPEKIPKKIEILTILSCGRLLTAEKLAL